VSLVVRFGTRIIAYSSLVNCRTYNRIVAVKLSAEDLGGISIACLSDPAESTQ
jgi:hypothetical protein